MVGEVHGRPPQPHGVEDVDGEQPGENVSHEQRLHGCPAGVQGGECTKDHGRCVECRGVHVDAEQRIDGSETRGVSDDGVVCGCQAINVLVPWWRAGEDDLDQDSGDVHVSKGAGPDGEGAGRAPDEHAGADDDGRDVVYDAVGDPSEEVEDGVLVGGQDVAEVCAVEDVFEGGQDADPDGRAVLW